MRQRVNRLQRRHLYQTTGREPQPLLPQTEHQQRAGFHLALDRDGHWPAIFLLQCIAIEQACGGRGIHRTIAAMNMLAEQRAGLVAVDTDAVPAIVDGLGIPGDAKGVGGDHRLRSLSAARALRAARSCNRLAPIASPWACSNPARCINASGCCGSRYNALR